MLQRDQTVRNSVVSVASNGVPNLDSLGIGRGGADANYQTYSRIWRFPQNPVVAANVTDLKNVLGAIAVMINGVQIYGPVEAPIDNNADPFKAGLLNYCGRHVFHFRYHSFPECFFNQKTLSRTTTFLLAKTPGIVLGLCGRRFPNSCALRALHQHDRHHLRQRRSRNQQRVPLQRHRGVHHRGRV